MASANFPEYCDICKKGPFGGPIPAKQHFDSQAHINKINNTNRYSNYSQESKRWANYCDVCNVFTSSYKELEKHRYMPRHLDAIKKRQEIELTGTGNHGNAINDSTKMVVKIARYIVPEATCLAEIEYNGKPGCEICKVLYTSQSTATQHIQGEKHKKALRTFNSAMNIQNNFNCNACNKTFSDELSLERHFESHKKTSPEVSWSEPSLLSYTSQSTEPSFFPSENLVNIIPGSNHRGNDEKLDELYRQTSNDIDEETALIDSERRNQISPQISQSSSSETKINNYEDVTEEYVYYPQWGTGHCNLCADVLFSSHQQAQQHLQGKKHQKAVLEWKRQRSQKEALQREGSTDIKSPERKMNAEWEEEYVFQGNRGFCNVCKIELTSRQHAEQHLAGKPHLKAKAASANPIKATKITSDDKNPVLGGDERQIPGQEYEFTGLRGFCYVCKIELTSREHAEQHLNGKPHQKAKVGWISQQQPTREDVNTERDQRSNIPQEYEFSGTTGYCYVCKLSLTSHENAIEHLRSKPHLIMKASYPNQQEASKQTSPAEPERKSATELSPNSVQEYEFSGTRGYCYICKIELTSREHAEQHLNGKPHQKAKAAASQMPSPGISGQTASPNSEMNQNSNVEREYEFSGNRGFCYVCNIELTSREHANQHLNGKPHQKKQKEAAIGNQMLPGQQTDKTIWHYCEVCKCHLNSLEQLMIHKNSPKHKAEEEKLARAGTKIELKNTPGPLPQTSGRITASELRNPPRPIVRVQETGPCDMRPDIMTTTSYMEDAGPQSFLSNQPGLFAQETEMEKISFNVESLNLESLTKPVTERSFIMQDDTVPKKVQFENTTSDTFASQNLNTFSSEKDIEKTPINERLTSSSSESSAEMPQLERIKDYKDLDNKIKQMHLSNSGSISPDIPSHRARAPGSYPHKISDNSSGKGPVVTEKQAVSLPGSHQQYNFNSSHSVNNEFGRKNVNTFNQSSAAGEGMLMSKNENLERKTYSGNQGQVKGGSEFNSTEVAKTGHSQPGQDHLNDANQTTVDENEPGEGLIYGRKVRSKGSESSHRSNTKNQSSRNTGMISLYDSSDNSSDSEECEDESDRFFHCTNQDVLRKLKEIENTSMGHLSKLPKTKKADNPYRDTHKYYCKICQRPMNSRKAYKDHLEGRQHMQKVAVAPASSRSHPPLVKEFRDMGSMGCDLITLKPRTYQTELFSKAMEGDGVVFLPTGTGKTLISCMVVSAMLEQNPTRQAVFLVDKVLLVIQQSRYLHKQLGNRVYKRFDHSDPSKSVERELKIAALCGGQQSTGGVPLWQHDLIVVTAAYFEILVSKKVLRWEDQSVVVFDEAHHCTKDHPFNKLLRKYHLTMDKQRRPKILGLTASPAGKKTVAITINMLQQLMENMGDTKMIVVKKYMHDLMRFQSSAELIVNDIKLNTKELHFRDELQLYLLNCYIRYCAETDMLDQCDLDLRPTQKNVSEEEKRKIAGSLTGDLLNSLEITLDKAKPVENNASARLKIGSMAGHIKYICYALNTLYEAGVRPAIEELQDLMAHDTRYNFDFAKDIGLKPQNLLSEIELCLQVELPGISRSPSNSGVQISSSIDKLIETLMDPAMIDWSRRDQHPMALVLVKQRSTAMRISDILKGETSFREKHLRVTYLIGHGSGGADGGMQISQQKKVLSEIKQHKYQVIVATSVAEEGIDIPECELVVSMNLPSTVTALVQMRGRARKEKSKFVVLCNDMNESEQLRELLKREDNMIKAANFLYESQNRPDLLED